MDWISSLLLATVRLAIPVLLISLAELYGQRAGMVNIGLEGLASIGARQAGPKANGKPYRREQR